MSERSSAVPSPEESARRWLNEAPATWVKNDVVAFIHQGGLPGFSAALQAATVLRILQDRLAIRWTGKHWQRTWQDLDVIACPACGSVRPMAIHVRDPLEYSLAEWRKFFVDENDILHYGCNDCGFESEDGMPTMRQLLEPGRKYEARGEPALDLAAFARRVWALAKSQPTKKGKR